MNTVYISAGEGGRSVKIKGLDDKGGREERWICYGFIAVVKILKVSEKSALTHPVKIKKMSEGILIGDDDQSRGRGWALVHLPRWDKRVSCLTEWDSSGCRTTKTLWTKVFFKVRSVWVGFLCCTSGAPRLALQSDIAICAGHLNLSACVLMATSRGHKLALVLWTGDQKCGNDAQPPCQRETERNASLESILGPCLHIWLRA